MALMVPRSFTASSSATAGLALWAVATLGSNRSTSQNTAIVPTANVTIVAATARMSFTIASPLCGDSRAAPSLNVGNAERLRDGTLGLVRDQRPTRTKVPWATLLRRGATARRSAGIPDSLRFAIGKPPGRARHSTTTVQPRRWQTKQDRKGIDCQ